MRKFRSLVAVSTLVLLSACGGGGGGKSSNLDTTYNGVKQDWSDTRTPVAQLDYKNVPADRKQEWDQFTVLEKQRAQAGIVGIYTINHVNVDGTIDSTYLSIDDQELKLSGDLVARSYNYMNDTARMEGDCYRESSGADINAMFNTFVGGVSSGTKLVYFPSYENPNKENEFRAYFSGQSSYFVWHFDTSGNLKYVGYGDDVSNINQQKTPEENEYFLSVGNNSLGFINRRADQSVTLGDIKGKMCQGLLPSAQTVGSTKFSGLYDVSYLDDSNVKNVAYLYIDQQGTATSYELQPFGSNCFKPAFPTNAQFYGRGLVYDKAKNALYSNTQVKVYFNLNDSGEIVSVNEENQAPAVQFYDKDHRISMGANVASGVTIETISSSLCK